MTKGIKDLDNKIINIMANTKWNLNISGFLDALELSIYPNSLVYESGINKEIYEENKQFLSLQIRKVSSKIEETYNNSKERKITFKMIRKKNPDFCNNIKKFLTEEELLDYELGITKYFKYMTGDFKTRNNFNIRKSYKEQYQEKIYDISQITDSPLFMKVGNMQDRYVLQQLNLLSSKDFSEEEVERIKRLKEEVNSHIERYGVFLKEKEIHTRKIEKEEIEI